MLLNSLQIHLLHNLRKNQSPDVDVALKAAAFILSDERKLLEAAVLLLEDTNSVKRIESNSTGRHFWVVSGNRGRNYVCFENFCPCRSFLDLKDTTAEQADKYVKICKHLVAINIAEAITNKVTSQAVNDFDFVEIMCMEPKAWDSRTR